MEAPPENSEFSDLHAKTAISNWRALELHNNNIY
jgi:hypothetical protein